MNPENFTPQNINGPDTPHIGREEILRLRKERREQIRLEKESQLDSKTDEAVNKLEKYLEQRQANVLAEELREKLEYYLQKNPDEIDMSVLADAIVESPHCVSDPECGISGLLKSHEMKTLQKIAEMRRNKTEQTEEGFNPYEALFQTESGEYYMARLLNMPHLKEESAFMNHCVGTSDSYINRMKKGEVEILSFRSTKTHEPLVTIEYDVKTKEILQMKKQSNTFLTGDEKFLPDFMEAISKLRTAHTDTGTLRDFKKILKSELRDLNVQKNHLLTGKGEVHVEDYNEKEHGFIFKNGEMIADGNTDKSLVVKLFKFVEGIEFKEEEIAQNKEEVSGNTKVYLGPLYPNIFKELPENIEHIYTKFPEHEVYIKTITLSENVPTADEYKQQLEEEFKVYETADYLLQKSDLNEGSGKTIRLIIPTVASLGFAKGGKRRDIQARAKELGIGLNLLPARIGPQLRLKMKEQKNGEYILIDMKSISSYKGHPQLFEIIRHDNVLWLSTSFGELSYRWGPDGRWAFSAD